MQIESSGFTVAAQWRQKGASCLMWMLALKKGVQITSLHMSLRYRGFQPFDPVLLSDYSDWTVIKMRGIQFIQQATVLHWKEAWRVTWQHQLLVLLCSVAVSGGVLSWWAICSENKWQPLSVDFFLWGHIGVSEAPRGTVTLCSGQIVSGHGVHFLKFMVSGPSVGVSDFFPRAPSVWPALLPRLSGAGAAGRATFRHIQTS